MRNENGNRMEMVIALWLVVFYDLSCLACMAFIVKG